MQDDWLQHDPATTAQRYNYCSTTPYASRRKTYPYVHNDALHKTV